MSLRIPLTKDQTLQTEFHEIERRLRRIERKTGVVASGTSGPAIIQAIGGGGSSTANLTGIISRIEALEAAIASLPEPGEVDIPVFGGVGLPLPEDWYTSRASRSRQMGSISTS